MSQSAVSSVETGTRWRIRWQDEYRLAKAIGITPLDLWKGIR